VLHHFAGGATDGAVGAGALAMDNSGKIYGVTTYGGVNGSFPFGPNSAGVVYEYNPGAMPPYAKKYDLGALVNNSSLQPQGGLIPSGNNTFYGSCWQGGMNGFGSVFEYNPANNTVTNLTEFTLGMNNMPPSPAAPTGNIVLGSGGNIIGASIGGGIGGMGTLFEVDLTNGTYVKLADFGNFPMVGFPIAQLGVIEAMNGNIYGLSVDMGGGFYTLYEYDTAGQFLNVKQMIDGYSPTSQLMEVACLPGTLTLNPLVCNSDYWSPLGNNYTMSGTYQEVVPMPSANGCDSLITINLTIVQTDNSVTNSDPILQANATNGTYQWLDCNNGFAPIAGATSQSFTATQNGSYALEITDNGCVDTSICYTVMNVVGIQENLDESTFNIYPNPSDGTFKISSEHLGQVHNITLVNLLGKKVDVDITYGPEITVETRARSGLYFLTVETASGVVVKRVVLR
jgi:uncharacterized repeat protein (TIGR03803 family)